MTAYTALLHTEHTKYQILATHTFTLALWRIGTEARGFAFGIVALTWLFAGLWVGIGNGIHKNYEQPSQVHYSHYLVAVTHSLHFFGLVLVLDWSQICGGTLSWGIHLDVDRFICLGDHVHPDAFLDEGLLVGQQHEVVQVLPGHVGCCVLTEASHAGNPSVGPTYLAIANKRNSKTFDQLSSCVLLHGDSALGFSLAILQSQERSFGGYVFR